jgi:uncharacterized membrane protein YfcA
MDFSWWLPLSGFGVGLIVGLTGVGGGSLMTPLLIGVFQQPAAVAIGTDLCFAAITKAGGSVAHHRQGHVDWTAVRQMLIGSVPASLLTLAALHAVGERAAPDRTLTLALGIALLLTAVVISSRLAWLKLGRALERRMPTGAKPAWTITAGALLGVLVTLSSIGAGAIGAALLLLLNPRWTAQRVAGTDIAHAVPLTLVAGLGHAALGHVNESLLLYLLVGSLPGIWIGARLTRALPQRLLRALLSAALVTAGLKVLS